MTGSFRGDKDGYAIAEVTFMGDLDAQGPAVRDHPVGTRRWPRQAFAAAKVLTGGAIWTFALMPD